MIEKGYLEKVPSFSHEGKDLPTEFLGYRITRRFTHEFLGRIFTDPVSVFPEDMLQPELQDADQYADSLNNLVEAGKLIAQRYFDDNSIEKACPPLRALLEVMYHGNWEGKGLLDKEFRSLFDPQKILASDWYDERLKTRISVTRKYWSGRIDYLDGFLADNVNREASDRLGIKARRDFAEDALSRLEEENDSITRIRGCLGTDPTLFD
jgi:hypothetical protein